MFIDSIINCLQPQRGGMISCTVAEHAAPLELIFRLTCVSINMSPRWGWRGTRGLALGSVRSSYRATNSRVALASRSMPLAYRSGYPEGMFDNSPAFQRRDNAKHERVPKGRLKWTLQPSLRD